MNKNIISVLLLIYISANYVTSSEKIVICYYGTWATYRNGLGKFDVEDINTDLCTHLVYTFVGINNEGTVTSLDPWLDLSDNYGRDNFRKFTALKLRKPNLKTLLAVGGWNEGSAKYSVMAANPSMRQNFIQSALKMIQDHGFDGFDVDWEYPNRRDTVNGQADVDNFTQLLRELREEFDKHGLLLTAAVASVKEMASVSYDIPAISQYLDIISVMAYDMYGAWDAVTGHNAPLHKGEGDEGVAKETLYTVDVALNYWLKQGCPREKLVLGMPLYGRTFTLANPNVNSVRAPASGAGIAGPYTATNGYMGYNEFCIRFLSESWDIRYDSLAKVPYAVQGSNWLSFDNAESLVKKVEYGQNLSIAGVMVWSIETDDFHGVCGDGDYPLLRAINNALGRDVATEQTTTSTTPLPTSSVSSTTASSTPAPSTSGVTSTTVTITSTTAPDLSICKSEGFATDPESCSSFYVCIYDANGLLVPKKFQCPENLYWDQESLYCNYKDLVDCCIRCVTVELAVHESVSDFALTRAAQRRVRSQRTVTGGVAVVSERVPVASLSSDSSSDDSWSTNDELFDDSSPLRTIGTFLQNDYENVNRTDYNET
ncbi:chitinase-3-like protein 1 [Aphomia sociella]